MAERATETASVKANCWYIRPVTPPMKATGTNTEMSTSEMAMTGPATSAMAALVASLGGSFSWSILCCTASTTTMASSTTMPMASTSPKSVSVLMEKPKTCMKAKVPTSDTGTVSMGMSVARPFCRKM